MKYRIGHYYSDPFGKGMFFMNKDGTVSWGTGVNNIIIEGEASALEEAARYNRPNKEDNWQIFPVRQP